MDADCCPRCGLPHAWTLRLRVRLVLFAVVLAFGAGFALGSIARWRRDGASTAPWTRFS